jgi:hypothetical protein
MIRFAAVAVAVMLSIRQFPLFDCNKIPVLSVASGTLTLLLIYAIGETVYNVVTSPRSTEKKVFTVAGLAVGGGGVVALAGFFTLITHLCP